MKFGQELASKENPKFKGQYINYKALKAILKDGGGVVERRPGEGDTAFMERMSAAFIDALEKVSARAAVAGPGRR